MNKQYSELDHAIEKVATFLRRVHESHEASPVRLPATHK
jgi:hypothetical protein